MGVKDAVIAAEFVGCNNIIGMHYDTFGYIVINKEEAVAEFNKTGKKLMLMTIGETIDL